MLNGTSLFDEAKKTSDQLEYTESKSEFSLTYNTNQIPLSRAQS